MKISLLPRSRVNYSWTHLFKSLFIRTESGKYTSRLKREIARYFGQKDVILTSSGRSGLQILISYLQRKKVIVPSYTCKAVTEAILMGGGNVQYVEVSETDFNMLPEELQKVVDKDSVVIATHQFGNPCRIEEIQSLCRRTGAILIEDCAASLGTHIQGQPAGSFGDYAFFSFDSTKLVTVPSKGGFIIAREATETERLATYIQKYQAPGVSFRIKHTVIGLIYLLLKNKYLYRGFHFLTMQCRNRMQLDESHELDLHFNDYYRHRMAEWQAYMALPQIENLDKLILRRKEIYRRYDSSIRETPVLRKPVFNDEACCIRYAIQVENKASFYRRCLTRGIDMAFSFSYIVCPASFTHAKRIAETVLDLPYYYDMKDEEVTCVINTINEIAAETPRKKQKLIV